MKRIPNLPPKVLNKVRKIVPILCIEAIIKTRKGVLLVRRDIKPYKGLWHIPGGCVGYGEGVRETVRRVAKKETGLRVKIKKFVGIYDDLKRDPRGHSISLAFLTEIVSGNIKGSKEGKEIRFFKKLPKNIGFDHRKILNGIGYK